MKRGILLVMVLLLLLPVVALAQQEEEADLRIGVLPVMNVYPFLGLYLGYYEEVGVDVQTVPLSSAQALREGIAAGELDGFQADLITTLVLLEAGFDVQLVRHVGLVSPPLFGILVGGSSDLGDIEDLRGARIGISANTVVQYVTDQMLANAGIRVDEAEYVDIPDIFERAEKLAMGEIDAATLPQPLYNLAEKEVANVLVNDSVLDYVPEAISFRSEVLAEKGDAVRAFLSAYERTLLEINELETYEDAVAWFGTANREQVRSQHLDRRFIVLLIRAQIRTIMTTARVPTAEEFAHAQDWALAAGLVMEARAYEEVVDGSYLPEMMADDMDDMSGEDEESDE